MNLIKKYSRKVLLKRAAEVKRKIRICSPDQVRKVGIVWQENDIKAFNYLLEYFRSKSVIVRNICFSTAKETTESNVLVKRDINWLGFPHSGAVEIFIKTDFDLLINVSTTPCFPLDVIIALSEASFKMGWDLNGYGFYDLTVNVSKNPDSLYLAEQQLFYLKSLKSKI
jgi:hypothetical protein